MEYLGKAKLLNVESYKSKNEQGEVVDRFKYSILVGEQDYDGGFIRDASVESCISDLMLLTGEENVFDEIDVKVVLKKYRQKGGAEIIKPVYFVVDRNGGDK